MKKSFIKTLAAAAVAVTAMALSSVAALAGTTYTLTADSDGLTAGETDGYFTANDACGYVKSGGVATFELKKNGAQYIYFTPEASATVKASFASTGSDDKNVSVLDICSLSGTTLTSLKQLSVAATTTPAEQSFPVTLSAGTTYAIANLGTERSTRVAYITVEEADSVAYPAFEAADTDTALDSGKSDTASMDMDITNAAEGNTAASEGSLADTEYFPGFTVYGAAVTADDVTTYNGMTIEANERSYNGTTYANRLKTNGVGSTSKYAIEVTVDDNSVIEVIGMSGNGSSTRPLVIATEGGTELASHEFVGSTMSTAEFSVTAGTYYLYAGPCTAGTNGGVNIYSLKVYDGVTYNLPVVTLVNAGTTSDGLNLTATVNSDYTAGEITGIGFILAKPDATVTTQKAGTYYKVNEDGDYEFTGVVSEQTLKAQAYVTFTSEADGSSVTRYSNTVTNTVE